MKTSNIILIGLLLMTLAMGIRLFIQKSHNQLKENSKSFAIDSVDYHQSGKDNTLQVTPYWKCHLKGTNVWVRVNENKKVGDSISMLIK